MPLTDHEYKQLRSAFQVMHEPFSGFIRKSNAIAMIGRWLEPHIRVTEDGDGDYTLSFDGDEEEDEEEEEDVVVEDEEDEQRVLDI